MLQNKDFSEAFLIFDFDGTLADSFHLVIEKLNQLAAKFNFRKIEKEELTELRKLSSKAFIQHLNIPLHKIPFVLDQVKKFISNEIFNFFPVKNIYDVLQKLHRAKFSLGIVTSNSIENVNNWLTYNEMQHFFAYVEGEADYFEKTQAIKKILTNYKINISKAFYIGDETRDIEAAQKNDIFSIAVTWGFTAEEILLQQQPNYIARKPEDLLVICGLKL